MPSTLVTLIPPHKLTSGSAEPILVRGNPHLLTCAHLVVGATRMAYQGSSIGFAIKCVDSVADIAIIEWHVVGAREFREIAEPCHEADADTGIATAPGDCGSGIGSPIERLVYSMHLPMRRNTVWRFVTSYEKFGAAMPLIRIPRVVGYRISAVDSWNIPEAYSYLGCKFPGEEVTIAYVHPSGARLTAEIRLLAQG